MRVVIALFACVVATACTANVPANRVSIAQRVADACDDLGALCTATGDCLPEQTYCGALKSQLDTVFLAEDGCKLACGGATTCIKSCKATRLQTVSTMVAGTGTTACSNLASDCAATGQGCLAGEFYCVALAPAPSPCSTQLDACKAACAPHDRTCLHDCRAAYKQCLMGGTTVDAGVPDAPTTKPDAPTVTPDAPTVTPDAPAPTPDAPTATKYTYTTDIAPKMSGLCNGCHSGGSAPAGYLTDSYTGLFGNGSDGTPNIIAGNGNSLFVQKIQGNHHNVLNQYPGFDTVAYDWVVNNNAAK